MRSDQVLRSVAYFFGVCLLSISFLVFVNASISFVITDVIQNRSNVGDNVGTLGFADEIVAMIASPLWGHLSDRVGTRIVVTLGYAIIAVSLACFVRAKAVFPDLLLYRIIFSVGGSAVSTMVTAILPAYVDFSNKADSIDSPGIESQEIRNGNNGENIAISRQLISISQNANAATDLRSKECQGSASFRNAGLVGMAAGCGALLAVFGYLRLPPALQGRGMSAQDALKATYYIIAAVSLIAAAFCLLGLRDLEKKGKDNSQTKDKFQSSYTEKPLLSLTAAYKNDSIALAYLGGFVARASSVGISLFIPLWINSYFSQSGRCYINDPSHAKEDCKEAYVLASILTGISQLAALLFAPVYGFLADRWRLCHEPLIVSSLIGFIGYLALSSVSDPRLDKTSSTLITVISSVLLGLSQIGATVCSLGLLGQAIATSGCGVSTARNSERRDDDTGEPSPIQNMEDENSAIADPGREAELETLLSKPIPNHDLSSVKGGLAGMYSFVGGVGILVLTKLGGFLFDQSSKVAPFWLLASFNLALLIGSSFSYLLRAIYRYSAIAQESITP